MCRYQKPENWVSINRMKFKLPDTNMDMQPPSADCTAPQVGMRSVSWFPASGLEPTNEQTLRSADWLSTYLKEQCELYLPSSKPLSQHLRALLWPYFSRELLDRFRIVELQGVRMAEPGFFSQVRALGFEPPAISHLDSMTFVEVVVFNEQLDKRALFNAFVHAVQIKILGLESYAELWVRGFVRTRTYFTVPLEVHAFSLASKFMGQSRDLFSVEDHVLRWVIDERY